jgi:fatty-acyl-CoA synthase
MLYGDWIGRWGRAHPQKEALVDLIEKRRYSYGELAADIHRLANFLIALDIVKGDRIAVLAYNRADYIKLFFAASRLGAILVPLNFRLAQDEYRYFLEDCTPKALFYDVDHQAVVAAIKPQATAAHYVCFDADDSVGQSLKTSWESLSQTIPPEVDIGAHDPQLILYTSGTTGLPKGVIQSHGMLVWNSFNTNIGWDLRSEDRTVLHAAMFYTAGWNIFTLPLFHCRGTNILIKSFDADLILDLVEEERISLFFGVPTMYQMLIDSPKFTRTDFSSLRFMVSGGAPLPQKIIDTFENQKGIHLWEGYGLTEVGPNNFLANGKPRTVGHPMFHVDVKVVNSSGHSAAPDEDGELLLKGEHVCSGYWNKPQETEKSIQGGWFHTGDLAKIDSDGHLSLVGRKKDMFISGGINIYPAEIERVIETHPAVAGAAVIGIADKKWGEVGKAIVELQPGAALSMEGLLNFLSEKLGRFKLPRYLTIVDELPRTPASGKVKKFILKETHGKPDNE